MYELGNLYYTIYLVLQAAVLLLALRYFYVKNCGTSNNNRVAPLLLGAMLVLICVFIASGDYWTYKLWYEMGFSEELIEPVFHWVKAIIPDNYDLFRTVIWGSGIVVLIMIFKLCDLDLLLGLYVLGVLFIGMYSYSRASVAMMLVVLGFIIYNKKQLKGSIRIALFFLLVLGGILTHRSMLIMIPAVLIAPFIQIRKNNAIVFVLLFPVFSLFLNIIMPYVKVYVLGSDYFGGKAEGYLQGGTVAVSYITAITQRLPILIMYFVSLWKTNLANCPNKLVRLSNSAGFLVLYTALLFTTLSGINSSTLFYRTLNMAGPFMVITITYAIMYNRVRMKNYMMVVIAYVFFLLMLSVRIFILHPDFIIRQVEERYLL